MSNRTDLPIRAMRAAVDSLERTMRPLTLLLGAVELLLADAVGVQALQLGADHTAGLLDVVLAGADVEADQPAVDELLRVGADRVGEPALLADLAEEARRGRAAEDGVEDRERVASVVAAVDAGAAEADVVLLGVLAVEPDGGSGRGGLELV